VSASEGHRGNGERHWIGRGIAVWFVLLVIAVANGLLREALLIPAAGAGAGRALSPVTLSAAIVLLCGATIGWIGVRSRREAWALGAIWLALTLAFEFLAGHYLMGKPWSVLLEDYDVAGGRTWPLVLATTLLAPVLTVRPRRPSRR
jgi:hypothetical protein